MAESSPGQSAARPDPDLWLHDLADALSAAGGLDDLRGAALEPALSALGAGGAAVLWAPGQALRRGPGLILSGAAPSPWLTGLLSERTLSGDTPAGALLLDHNARYFHSAAALEMAFPALRGAPLAAATAALPLTLAGELLGALVLEFTEAQSFSLPRQRSLRSLAALTAQALGRLPSSDPPEPGQSAQPQRGARRLDDEAEVQDAFMAFTEAVGTQTDLNLLTRQAVRVLQANFGEGAASYFVRQGELFILNAWTPDIGENPALLTTLQAGLALDTPIFADALQTRQPVFVDAWNAEAERIATSSVYDSAASAAIVVGGEVRGMLAGALRRKGGWSPRDRAVFQAVARGLRLALERADITAQLERQNAELAARTQALEAFAELTRDLGRLGDSHDLVRRAQEVVMSLLPLGYALYYERDGRHWRSRVQVGDVGHAELQAFIDAGPLVGETPSLDLPWISAQPYYQDLYLQGSDTPVELVRHVNAAASLPVMRRGQPVGVFIAVLFEQRPWTSTDRVVLETVVRSLELAQERTEQTRQLQEERAALEAFTAFTEAAGVRADVLALSHQAFGVLRTRFSDTSTAVYYEVEGDLLFPRSWSEDIDDQPELLEVLRAGIPLDTPLFAESLRSGEPTFTEDWNAQDQQIAHSEAYGAAAVYPLKVREQLLGFLGLGLRSRRNWTELDMAVVRSVGRSLTLALERAAVVEQLAQRTRELEHSNAELEQFAYVASHDLQEPLRSVTSFAQLLAARYGQHEDARVQQYTRIITEGTGRMAQLIQDLLAFSRVATSETAFGEVQTQALVDGVLQDLHAQQERARAQVGVSALPDVLGDASQLRQLFQNLIGNALKFHHPERPPQVQVSAVSEGARVRFTVSDNGIGISEEFHERIFGIFQRLHTRDVYEGSGIGLSIARKIVERHGGTLSVRPQQAEGTSFTFTLPARPGAASPA